MFWAGDDSGADGKGRAKRPAGKLAGPGTLKGDEGGGGGGGTELIGTGGTVVEHRLTE